MLPGQVAQFTGLKSRCSVESQGPPRSGQPGRGQQGRFQPGLAQRWEHLVWFQACSGPATCRNSPRSTNIWQLQKKRPFGFYPERVRNWHVLQAVRAKCCLTEGEGLDPLLPSTNAPSQSLVATNQFIPIAQLGALGGARCGRDVCLIQCSTAPGGNACAWRAGSSLVADTAGRASLVLAVPGAAEVPVGPGQGHHPVAVGICSRRAVSWGAALSSRELCRPQRQSCSVVSTQNQRFPQAGHGVGWTTGC